MKRQKYRAVRKFFSIALALILTFAMLPPALKVGALGDTFSAVSAGGWHSLAVKSDGSLWAWGWNIYGQLGDGTTADKSSPVKIMDGVKAVSTGYYNSVALKSDGSLWTW